MWHINGKQTFLPLVIEFDDRWLEQDCRYKLIAQINIVAKNSKISTALHVLISPLENVTDDKLTF